MIGAAGYLVAVAIGIAATALGLAGMLGMRWTLDVPWLVPLGGLELVLDPLGGFFVALVGFATVPASVYAIGDTRGGRRGVLAYLVFILSMGAVPLAANMMTFVIAWELMHTGLTGAIIGIRNEKEAREMLNGVG